MFKHIMDKFMTDDIKNKLESEPEYYTRFYGNYEKFFKAVGEGDMDLIKKCVILGGVDVNYRIRFNTERRDNKNDIIALPIAISTYNLNTANMLLEMGASIEGVCVNFDTNDFETANSENLKKAIEFCEEHGIEYNADKGVEDAEEE